MFRGPHIVGELRRVQERYAQAANEPPLNEVFRIQKRPLKKFRGEDDDITFSEEDAREVHHPHNDPLVVIAMIGNLNVHRTLVDD